MLRTALACISHELRRQVYEQWLGFYNSHLKRLSWSREELVRRANRWVGPRWLYWLCRR